MAAPTVTCYPVTGTACTKGSAQTQVDYGNVLAGADSAVKGMVYTPVSNSISAAVLWLQAAFVDTALTMRLRVATLCADPTTLTVDDTDFADMATTEGGGTSIDEATSDDDQIADGQDTERVYTGVIVGAGATDGTKTCNMRLSYQYP